MIDEELKQRIIDVYILTNMKGFFNAKELAEIYDVYNQITSENKPVSTCSSCLTSVVNRIKRFAKQNRIV